MAVNEPGILSTAYSAFHGDSVGKSSGLSDSEETSRSLEEVDSEAVALVCCEALGLPGAAHCRGYLQAWNERRGREPIPEHWWQARPQCVPSSA